MKKFFLLFLLTAFPLMLFLYSCSKDENEDSSLSVEYDYSQSVNENGGTATFNIKTTLGWVVSNADAWITSIEPKQGNGNKTITVTFDPNNETSTRSSIFVITAGDLKEEVLINQLKGKFPAAAGPIYGDDEGSESVILSIDEIENASTYKWYKNGSEVQNSAERTYVATESGTYTVAGVNPVGEGQSSTEKVVSITAPLAFEDLPEGTFIATGMPEANVGGYLTWNGTVTREVIGMKNYYIISHWGGSQSQFNFNLPLQYNDGRLIIDNDTVIIYDDQTTAGVIYEGSFQAFYVDANSTVHIIDGFSPEYDKNEAIINFSGTYNGYSVYVGVISLLNGEFAGVFSEIYENARVIITPGNKGSSFKESAQWISGDKVHISKLLKLKELGYGGKEQFNPALFLSE